MSLENVSPISYSLSVIHYLPFTICHSLKAHGRAASTAAASVEQGTTTVQRNFVGDLGSQPVIMVDRQLRAPTLIRVGGVVALLDGLNWYRSGDEIRLD